MVKIMLPHKSTVKYILLCICLIYMHVFSSCAFISPAHVYDDFILVKPRSKDTLSSLAEKYLNDRSKGWVIAEFNTIRTVNPGQELVIPLRPFRKGGLKTCGYQTVPILAYHNFSKTSASKMVITESAFEEQMKFLKENGYNVITLDQLLDFMDFKEQIPEKSVVITIDDGWKSNIDITFPVLRKYGFPATLFVYTDFIGGKKAMTWEQIKKLEEEGFDIQCHTKIHRNLTKLKKEESFNEYFHSLEREISHPKRVIKRKLGKECTYLAYPYGETDNLVIALLKKYGYRAAFTVNRGGNPLFIDNYRINRSVIYGEYNMAEFKKNLVTLGRTKLK